MSDTQRLDSETTIVGAGPYGISIAAHLEAARKPYVLLGSPLESWRRYMPAGMILKSERFASNLWDPHRRYTLQRYCELKRLPYQPIGNPLSLALFLDYACWFREHAIGRIYDKRVARIARTPKGHYRLDLACGDHLTSRRVILATGHMNFCHMPPELQAFCEPFVSHSARIASVQSYSGRNVTIVGAGQSGLETAALLFEAGAQVRVLVRRNRVEWNSPSRPRPLLRRLIEPDAGIASGWKSVAVSELPRLFRLAFPPLKRHRFVAGSYGPSGAWWLRDRVEGSIQIDIATRLEHVHLEDNRLLVRTNGAEGTREHITDHVIAATGFKVDVDQMDYLDPTLRLAIAREADGIPALNSHFETSLPGLFVVGIASAPVFGPIMRFMYGAKHAARVLARHLKGA